MKQNKSIKDDVHIVLEDNEAWPALRRLAIALSLPYIIKGLKRVPVLGTIVMPWVGKWVGKVVDKIKEKVLKKVDSEVPIPTDDSSSTTTTTQAPKPPEPDPQFTDQG